jgi:peptidoglycan/xylan/chitin deacetylase (PgdA/CDA1 family)
VLDECGFPSIVYAIAGMLGGRAQWLAADGHATARLMDAAQLRDLASHGVEIGSHSMHHLRLSHLPAAAQRAELSASRECLADLLGRPVDHVCYPYGAHDEVTLQAAADAGYRSGVTCQRGAATPAFDALALPRKAVSRGDDLVGFLWKVYAKDAPKGQSLRREAIGAGT